MVGGCVKNDGRNYFVVDRGNTLDPYDAPIYAKRILPCKFVKDRSVVHYHEPCFLFLFDIRKLFLIRARLTLAFIVTLVH